MISVRPELKCGIIQPRNGVRISVFLPNHYAVLVCESTGISWTASCQDGSWVERKESEYPCPAADVGCGEIKPRDGIRVSRYSAELECEATGRKWTATCQGGSWVEEEVSTNDQCPLVGR